MLERTVIQTRGFHNYYENGSPAGFEFGIRLKYYRGIFLSQLRLKGAAVDGVSIPKEQLILKLRDRCYTYEEMKTESNVHWSPDEPASIILKGDPLSVGYHKVEISYQYSSSYIPPVLQDGVDNDLEPSIGQKMAGFDVCSDSRELLLVY